MDTLQNIVGHEDILEHLRNAKMSGRVAQAYLFAGEKGSGRMTLARYFAMLLNCEKGGTEPCMACTSCRKAMSGNHPDILVVQHEKPNVIRIDEIREQILSTVEILPYESLYKVYIIPDAEKMNPNAQNALLKTIEEPPSYAVFLLLTTSEEALLPTVRSRCVTLRVRPLSDDQVEQYLMHQLHVPDYEAKVAAALAQGNIGRARAAVRDETFSRISEAAIRLVKRISDMRAGEFVEMIKKMKEEKENIDVCLDMFRLWFRDVLLYKATRDVDLLIFKSELSAIRAQAAGSSYEGMQKILDAIDTAKKRLSANVSFDLTMELLFLNIRENCHV